MVRKATRLPLRRTTSSTTNRSLLPSFVKERFRVSAVEPSSYFGNLERRPVESLMVVCDPWGANDVAQMWASQVAARPSEKIEMKSFAISVALNVNTD